MASQVPQSAGLFLLLLLIQDQGGAKPLAELQTLSQLLEKEPEQQTGSEETEMEQVAEGLMPGTLDQPDLLFPWAMGAWEDGAFQRLLSDLLSSTRRFRGRRKKGLSRGCFGVKLDRIGTWSGLGC